MVSMWMVRSDGGRLFDAFREASVVALGWRRIAAAAIRAPSREALIETYASLAPELPRHSIVSGASQVWRFVHDMRTGDFVVSYSPQRRMYLLGEVAGDARHWAGGTARGLPLVRDVHWRNGLVARAALSPMTRNRLCPTQSIFRIAPGAARNVVAAAAAATSA